jgi:hypothetical protein
MNSPAASTRGVPLSILVALAVVVVVAIVLVAKNLMIDNSVIFQDEYVYRAWSDLAFSRHRLLDAAIVPAIPNRLFVWVYGITTYGGLNRYDLAQLLNVVFWGVGTVATTALARHVGVQGWRLVTLAVALSLLPWSAYTKYFMPEAMYAGIYLLGILVLVKAVDRDRWQLFAVFGFITGLLYFVKPHGLIVLGIDMVFLLTLRARWRKIGAFVVGLAVALILVRRVTPKLPHPPGSSLGVYTLILQRQLDHLLLARGAALDMLSNLAYVSIGHLMMFFMLCGMPFVAALGIIIPRFKLWEGGAVNLRTLALYLILSTFVLFAVAVVFTVLAGELGHIHSRYYIFIWPLWACMGAVATQGHFTRRGAVLASVLTTAATCAVVIAGSTYSEVIHLSFVSGSPEWGIVFAPEFLMTTCLLALLAASLYSVWKKSRDAHVWLCAFAIVGAVSTVMAAIGQRTDFRNSFTDGRDAIAVQQVLGRDVLERSLVIGRDIGEVDKFLFFLQATPYISWVTDSTDIATAVAAHPQADRVILLAPVYAPPSEFNCVPLASVRVCNVPGRGISSP